MYSRRDFGKIAVAGVPFSVATGSKTHCTVNSLHLGAITCSFRDFSRGDARRGQYRPRHSSVG